MHFEETSINVSGYDAHVWHGGKGYPILMMHGAGPGTSSAGNFAKVRIPMSKNFNVFGTDMIGFGKSAQKLEAPFFDYDLWLQQMQAVLDSIPAEKVGLVGHSISATFAIRLASKNNKVDKILLTCPMGTDIKPNSDLETLWTYPTNRESLVRSLKVLINNHDLITDDLIQSRLDVLEMPGYREYFEKVFYGPKSELIRPTILSEKELGSIKCPVTIIHGLRDLAFPQEQTAMLLCRSLPQADLHLLAKCSHGPAFERPEEFLNIAIKFFGGTNGRN